MEAVYIAAGCFFILASIFVWHLVSYLKAEEMLTMLKVSEELDFQYDRAVRHAVLSSKSVGEAVDKLKKEVGGTILEMGGRNHLMAVSAEWRGK